MMKRFIKLLCLAAAIALTFCACGGRTAEEETAAPPPPEREHIIPDGMRGVYVPSVYNLAFPSAADLDEETLKAELDGIVAKTKEVGLNAVFLQVRPSFDALYRSDVYPVSKYLSSSGLTLDCLEYLVSRAHAEGIAVGAWINPLRVSVDRMTKDDLPDSSPAKDIPDSVVSYGGKLYLDPGSPAARDLVCRGVREIVEGYEVDYVIFDDYFYPYAVYETNANGENVVAAFDDEDTFDAFSTDGETLSDFRRRSVNELIMSVFATVKEADPVCRFGVAPFGIWQNNDGENGGSDTFGLESYSELYCDTVAWIDGGYVDFVAPQIYWDTESLAANFKTLADWWNDRVDGKGVELWISHAAYRYEGDDFDPGEMTEQLAYTAGLKNVNGCLFYSYAALRDDLAGICEEFTEYFK